MKFLLSFAVVSSVISCGDVSMKEGFPKKAVHVKKVNDSLTYVQLITKVDSTRKKLKELYRQKSAAGKDSILSVAANYLLLTIGEEFYQYWKGTPWDFNGTTTTPNKGSIACGYFVTGLLQDAGYKLKRIQLSTCASSVMMKKLTSSKDIKNLSNLSNDDFVKWVHNSGKDLYITGLDFHTGFIINDGKEVWFMHSNYISKAGVIKERAIESAALKSSKTKYITCLTKSTTFLQRWLLN